jgi:nucleoside-diphosphate-sugar epimerase
VETIEAKEQETMRYFVTGATGFVGGEVARQLVEAGHQVTALARTASRAERLARMGVTVCPGDVAHKESMRESMAGADGVFHVAGWYRIGARDRQAGEQVNVAGTRNVLELMKELEIPKGVYTSSVVVNSDTRGGIVDESHYYSGPWLNEYERTKWRAHHQVALPMIVAGLPLVIVQPGAVYGPGDTGPLQPVFSGYLQRKLHVLPQGAAYCWVHVEDAARGHILAMERGKPGESYLLTGPCHTLIEAVAMAEMITGIPAPRRHVPPWAMRLLAVLAGSVERVIPLPETYSAESLRTSAGATYLASSEKARRELGFTARSLEEGLRDSLRYEMEGPAGKEGV